MSEVVVIGSGITVLGTLRCLAHAGITAVVLSEQQELERFSKYYKQAVGAGGNPLLLKGFDRASVEAALANFPSGSVVIPCSDHAVKAVSGIIAAGSQYRAVVPAPDLLAAITDKAEFSRLIDKYGVPHPATFIVEPGSPMIEIPSSGRSYFIKPRDSQAFFRIYGVKGMRLEAGEDPSARIAEIRGRGLEVVIQEYIPGGAENHIYVEGYVDSGGVTRTVFARRRLRMYPPDYGNSTAMVSIPVAEVQQAADDLLRLLKETNYRGIFSAEFKFDSADGLFKLIEINPRAWWYVHFAEMCGVNIPALNVRDASGETPASIADYKLGRRSIYGYYDIYALAGRYGGLLAAAAKIPANWVGATFLVFALDDPLPAVMTFSKQLAAAVKTRLRRLTGGGKRT